MDPCFTPGQVLLNPLATSAIGEVAEVIIKADYCAAKGGCQEFLKFPPPNPQNDFFDVAMGFSRCRHLAAYLKLHNPTVDEVAIGQNCEAKKQGIFRFPVPDIITHDLPPGRLEFYEIKPNSTSGRRGADDKVYWFLALSHIFGLPYLAGDQYTPDKRILVWDGTWLGSPAKVHFHWFWSKKGVLLYEFCIEANLDTLLEMLWKQLIKAVILILILIILETPSPIPEPGPAPGLPPKIPNPFPIPAPVPVPAFLAPAQSMTSPLQQSVGNGPARAGVNAVEDVSYVQLMLNHWLSTQGLAQLDVDGAVGPLTEGAIHSFQQQVTGIDDGVIDAGGPAIAALEQSHWLAVLESFVYGFDGPLQGEFTTEDNDDDNLVAYTADEVNSESAQDYYDSTFQLAQDLRNA